MHNYHMLILVNYLLIHAYIFISDSDINAYGMHNYKFIICIAYSKLNTQHNLYYVYSYYLQHVSLCTYTVFCFCFNNQNLIIDRYNSYRPIMHIIFDTTGMHK